MQGGSKLSVNVHSGRRAYQAVLTSFSQASLIITVLASPGLFFFFTSTIAASDTSVAAVLTRCASRRLLLQHLRWCWKWSLLWQQAGSDAVSVLVLFVG